MNQTTERYATPHGFLLAVAVVLSAVLVLSGCTQGTTGIFASIEREVKTDQNNLPDDATPTGLVRVTDGTSDWYYVAAQRLYRREATTASNGDVADWNTVAPPSSSRSVAQEVFVLDVDGSSSYALASDGSSELFAVFTDNDRNSYGLYQLKGSGGNPSWEEIDLTADAGFTPDTIVGAVTGPSDGVGAHDTVFLTATGNDAGNDGTTKESRLLISQDPAGSDTTSSDWAVVDFGGSSGDVVIDVAITEPGFPNTGTTDARVILVGRNGGLYTYAAPSADIAAETSFSDPDNDGTVNLASYDAGGDTLEDGDGNTIKAAEIRGVSYVPDPDGTGPIPSMLLVSSRGGYVAFIVGNGAAGDISDLSWTRGDVNTNRAFSDLAYLGSSSDSLFAVVGTTDVPEADKSADGYREFAVDFSETEPTISDLDEPDGNSYATADLSDSAITRFFVDDAGSGADPILFALTGGTGLWRTSDYTGTTSSPGSVAPEWSGE